MTPNDRTVPPLCRKTQIPEHAHFSPLASFGKSARPLLAVLSTQTSGLKVPSSTAFSLPHLPWVVVVNSGSVDKERKE